MLNKLALVLAAGIAVSSSAVAQPASDLRLVVVVTRHGVRSPTNPVELAPYVAYPMASWEVAPGELTPNGATMMRNFGASYRAQYSAEGLLPATGCPAPDAVFIWSDVDQRTRATGNALLDGFAPGCRFASHGSDAATDPLFHSLPALGKADPTISAASVASEIGSDPNAIVRAHALVFAKLDAVLGCETGGCTRVSSVRPSVKISAKNGLASADGAVDLASTAVEDFILAYADGKPLASIGRGAVDRETLLELSELHTLKFETNTEPQYIARVQGSNLLSHVVATLDRSAPGTRVPPAARFVAFVGHDTNLEEFAGMLHLRWLLDGYQPNDTPPGGALVFEIHAAPGALPFVQTYFEAQSLDQMRELSKATPARVRVLVPGCPTYDCPLSTFDSIAKAAIDPAFVSTW